MNDFIEIEILNWEKYNPRTDSKSHSWFRFQNTLIDSPEFFKWPGNHIKVLIYLLSKASLKKSSKIRVYPEHAVSAIVVSNHDVRETIQKLVFLDMVAIRRQGGTGVKEEVTQSNFEVTSSHPVPTNVRTYERTNEQKPAPPAPEPVSVRTEVPKTGAMKKHEPADLRGNLTALEVVWKETLRIMKAPREVREREREKIARMIQAHGAEDVKRALLGVREEKPSDTFDPKQHLSLDRVFLPKNVERFINLGSAYLAKKNLPAGTKTETPEITQAVDPKTVAGFLGRFSKHSKSGGAA